MKRALVWFKTNLRLTDNEALTKAISESDEIIPFYCFDEVHFKTTKFGFKKTGNFRAQFLIESLIGLDTNLREAGSGLIVTIGNPVTQLIDVIKKYNIQKVYAQTEVAFEELHLQANVERELLKLNCKLETYCANSLYQVKDLPFSVKNIPDVFTNYRKQVEKESDVRAVFIRPTSIKSPVLDACSWPTLAELNLESIDVDKRAVLVFKGGETAAWDRLEHYFFESKSLSNYKETRNELVGANYSSKFSAWLALGCISAKSIFYQVKKFEQEVIANDSTYWLIFELLWRDYFRLMIQKYGHQFFLKNGIRNESAKMNSHNHNLFEQWKSGTTKNDFIDANMLELKHTGFMSNRGRQNVASYLVNDLKLDWRYGAAYFEEQLIDYDVCSNWGNWAYVAGVGNDPRSNRVFNTEKQANDYDRDIKFRNLWLR